MRQSSSLPLPGETQTSSPTSSGLRPASLIMPRSRSKTLSTSSPGGQRVGHEAVAILGHALEGLLGVAAEPHRHLARLGARIDAAVGRARGYLPLKLTPSLAHSACMKRTCSAERTPRVWKSMPRPWNSISFQPTPTPSRNRPSHKRVEGGRLLGHQRRLALRQDQHAGGKADLLGDAGQEAEQHEGIVIGGGIRAALAAAWIFVGIDADHVVGGDEIVEAQPFGGLRIVAHDGGAGADIADRRWMLRAAWPLPHSAAARLARASGRSNT